VNGTETYCGHCKWNICWSNTDRCWVHWSEDQSGWLWRECAQGETVATPGSEPGMSELTDAEIKANADAWIDHYDNYGVGFKASDPGPLIAVAERLIQRSAQLNSTNYRLAVALGLVKEPEPIEVNPDEVLDQVCLRLELANWYLRNIATPEGDDQ